MREVKQYSAISSCFLSLTPCSVQVKLRWCHCSKAEYLCVCCNVVDVLGCIFGRDLCGWKRCIGLKLNIEIKYEYRFLQRWGILSDWSYQRTNVVTLCLIAYVPWFKSYSVLGCVFWRKRHWSSLMHCHTIPKQTAGQFYHLENAWFTSKCCEVNFG